MCIYIFKIKMHAWIIIALYVTLNMHDLIILLIVEDLGKKCLFATRPPLDHKCSVLPVQSPLSSLDLVTVFCRTTRRWTCLVWTTCWKTAGVAGTVRATCTLTTARLSSYQRFVTKTAVLFYDGQTLKLITTSFTSFTSAFIGAAVVWVTS